MSKRIALALIATAFAFAQQKLDLKYSEQIKAFTTEPFFLTEIVDHLPASDTIPTPEKVLGYVIGAPEKLTYSKDIHRYMRDLARTSPRVRALAQGTSEEGRETLLVLVSDEANLRRLDRIKEITAKLADPRKLQPDESAKLIEEGVPFYWASGSIHSPETGSPEMLMELAYRLAVEETPLIQSIRKNSIVMITPVLEVDGHDKQVDLYRWRKANPGKAAPSLVYWGKYVAHDNNRDGMALSLNLSKIVMKTFLDYHPQVLHDLHESIPYLYTSTGTGPYNAWLDPIVINEWQRLAYHEVEEMAKRGVPGVWTQGFYDGWAANYMFMVAQGHNSIGRFYETFGNGGADTRERTLTPSQTSRQWFRPNPPLEKVRWSMRNNVNLQQSAILLAMDYVARNKALFLENFYLKSRRAVEKATKEGPAAYVIPGDNPRPAESANLVNQLRLHGIEVHRASGAFEIGKDKFAGSSYVIRMDQPYSRMADMLLDTQYYSSSDPRPYDDTGWTMGPLRNVKTVRVTHNAILNTPMTLLTGAAKAPGSISGSGTGGYLIAHNADSVLATMRFRLRNVRMYAAEAGFKAANRDYPAGSFLIPSAGNPRNLRGLLAQAAAELGIAVTAVDQLPQVAQHPVAAPRILLVHSWLSTQAEGWFRLAFDTLKIPYEYASDHVLRENSSLRINWDVIILGPTPAPSQRVVNGMPLRGSPIPWMKSDLTPNIGMSPDTTPDMRGGMGLEGLINVRRFVNDGGLFVTIAGNASIPIDFGLIEGVTIQSSRELQARGSVVSAVLADKLSPIAYGYEDKFALYFNQSPLFQVSLTAGLGRSLAGDAGASSRPSGRGSATDPDVPQARPYVVPQPAPRLAPGEEPPIPDDLREQYRAYLPEPSMQPRVVVRFADEKELFVSGMLSGGRELANKPAVVDVPSGKGHYLLFANNPMWRMQTQGSHFLLFNAMLNFDHLSAGKEKPSATASGL